MTNDRDDPGIVVHDGPVCDEQDHEWTSFRAGTPFKAVTMTGRACLLLCGWWEADTPPVLH